MINISFIVPVYNVEQYLRKCVDSLLAQDYKDYEIILVDFIAEELEVNGSHQ